jgi:hypothetical protein
MKFPKKIPLWVGVVVAVVVLVVLFRQTGVVSAGQCPGGLYDCPGVGCVSGKDKCFPGSAGGPTKVFSKETFEGQCKAKTSCPGGYRSDGPCLMEFPSF